MYLGLPLPRVENLPNGGEAYVSLDSDGFLQYLNDSYGNAGIKDIVNPLSGRAISRINISVGERVSLINKARANCVSEAPVDSYSLNPLFDGINLTAFPTPESSSPQITDLFNKGKGAEVLEDVDLTPKPGPSKLPDIDYNLGSNPFD
jgi:hypothetical protein